MAGINFDKLRHKKENINNKSFGDRDERFLRLEPESEYVIRLLPPDGDDPCEEYFMHYNTGMAFVCEKKQNGGQCPLCETAIKIYKDKSSPESERKVAKKLNAQKRCYSKIVLRGTDGAPDKPYIWSYATAIEDKIIGLLLNTDYGDITDIESGTDLVITTSARENSTWGDGETNNSFKVEVTPRRKESPLAANRAAAEKIIAACPKVRDCVLTLTPEETKKRLDEFLLHPKDYAKKAEKPADAEQAKKEEKELEEKFPPAKEKEAEKPKKPVKKAAPAPEPEPDESELPEDEEIPEGNIDETPF